MSWSCLVILKSRSSMDAVCNRWEICHIFVQGLHPWFQGHLNSKILNCDFQLPTVMGVQSKMSLSVFIDILPRTLVNKERFKYLFFTAMKMHTMAHLVKKQNNFIFSSLVIKTCPMCFNTTIRYGIIVEAHQYLICIKILPVQCSYETVRLSVLLGNSPCTFILLCKIIQFGIREKHYFNFLLISNFANI